MSEVRRPERTGGPDRPIGDLHPDYPLPDVDHPVTRPFWDGCRERRLRTRRPLAMVVVELDEGPRLVGYMVGCTPEEVAIGRRVRVVFKPLTERVVLPVWELLR